MSGTTSLIRHLQILRTVTEAVSRSLDLNEVVQKSLAALTHVTGHEIASLHLISADGNNLLLRGDRGLSDRAAPGQPELPMGQGLIGRVALSGTGAPGGRRQPRPRPPAGRARRGRSDGIRGFVCVPIRARHRILGTLSLGRQTEDRFTDEEVALLECVADQIGLALDNARLYGEISRQLDDLRRAQIEVVRAERLAAVDGLAAGVAHEINNPLTIIMAQLHLLAQATWTRRSTKASRSSTRPPSAPPPSCATSILFAEHSPAAARALPGGGADHEGAVAFEEARLEGARASRSASAPRARCPTSGPTTTTSRRSLLHLLQNAQHAMRASRTGGALSIRVKPAARRACASR